MSLFVIVSPTILSYNVINSVIDVYSVGSDFINCCILFDLGINSFSLIFNVS